VSGRAKTAARRPGRAGKLEERRAPDRFRAQGRRLHVSVHADDRLIEAQGNYVALHTAWSVPAPARRFPRPRRKLDRAVPGARRARRPAIVNPSTRSRGAPALGKGDLRRGRPKKRRADRVSLTFMTASPVSARCAADG
jgi:hypothetical protein